MRCLMETHAQEVFRSAFNAASGDRGLAEEATNDAFAEAAQTMWEAFLTWDAERQLAWLRRRARDRAIDGWRKNRRTMVTDDPPEAAETVLTEEAVLGQVVVDRCWKVILGMEPRRRHAAYLCWHEGRSITEVARMLGVDRSTASRDLAAVANRVGRELADELGMPDWPNSGNRSDRQDAWEEGA
jgi:RNA polymerase sigma factor (sigma-70 family)